MIELNSKNYFSQEAGREYMSCSQYIDFVGGGVMQGCEAMAVAKLKGEWIEEDSKALLMGSYVHAWNEGAEARKEFSANHPEIFKKGSALLADYVRCDEMIKTLENDEFCMYKLQGQKEVIFTAEMFGTAWKIRIDSYSPEKKQIVDLKTTKSIIKKEWCEIDGKNVKLSFVEAYNYLLRAAVYAEVERLANGRPEMDWLNSYVVAVSKEPIPDKAVIGLVDEERYLMELEKIRMNMPRILDLKAGKVEPVRCGKCDYCITTKVLSPGLVIHYKNL